MLWLLFPLALVVAYLRIGWWFRSFTAAHDAVRARREWTFDDLSRSSFRARQYVSLFFWPVKGISWLAQGPADDRWQQYDPVSLQARERRIADLERELGVRWNP